MSLFTWLQLRMRDVAGQRSGVHGSPRWQTTFRPRLEVLEGRDVPSTLTVTNNLDFGTGSLRYEREAKILKRRRNQEGLRYWSSEAVRF